MWTINLTQGERKTLRVVPRLAGGAVADLSCAAVELRVTAANECLILSGASQSGEGVAFELSDATLALPPGRYALALWITWADGSARTYGRGVLAVQKGC